MKAYLLGVPCFFTGLFLSGAIWSQQSIYKTTDGTIAFISEAPLEVISASSKKMEGVIDADAQTFAFSVQINTFEGFNNGLQRQHFYENYMETNKYPAATFSGKIIEHTDLKTPGTYTVRAKGQLNIHGQTKERIIKVEIVSTGDQLNAKASFMVPLVDHQIEVPRIVNQKIAQEIAVTVQARLRLDTKS
ncbi:MAG TPA: YceI family protein [Saprospiraceae bacterium]|nr:YceI family protein [Saprospiraceae bacterium]